MCSTSLPENLAPASPCVARRTRWTRPAPLALARGCSREGAALTLRTRAIRDPSRSPLALGGLCPVELSSWVGGGGTCAAEGPATPTRGIGAAPRSRSLGRVRALARAPGRRQARASSYVPGRGGRIGRHAAPRALRATHRNGPEGLRRVGSDARRAGAHLRLHFSDHLCYSVWSITWHGTVSAPETHLFQERTLAQLAVRGGRGDRYHCVDTRGSGCAVHCLPHSHAARSDRARFEAATISNPIETKTNVVVSLVRSVSFGGSTSDRFLYPTASRYAESQIPGVMWAVAGRRDPRQGIFQDSLVSLSAVGTEHVAFPKPVRGAVGPEDQRRGRPRC